MKIFINDINNFLKNLFKNDIIKDIAINGIQVETSSEIKKIAFSVDISNALIDRAIVDQCNLIIVHHGFFWGSPIPVTGIFKKRIELLLENNIGLIAYHLPLDTNIDAGNNAQILKALGVTDMSPFGFDKGFYVGFKTELSKSLNINEINCKLNISDNFIYLDFGISDIKKIAVVSGSGSKFIDEAINDKVDLFITGDSEHIIYHTAKENKINVLFAGHYMTETFGIKELKNLIKKKFNVNALFYDLPTGL